MNYSEPGTEWSLQAREEDCLEALVRRGEKVGCLGFDAERVEQEADYFAAVGLVFALVKDLLG